MDESAVGADAIRQGLTKGSDFYDTFSVSQFHDPETCTDASCGRCGKSTPREALPGNERAGDHYDGQGKRHLRTMSTRSPDGSDGQRLERGGEAYTPEIVAGGARAIAAIDHDPEQCTQRGCGTCDAVNAEILQPGYSIPPGGGGSKGRVRKAQRPITGPERIDRHLMGSTPFDEGHTAGRSVGRPRIGVEVRVSRTVRLEPSTVAAVQSVSSEREVLETFAAMLVLARNGAQRDAVVERVLEILARDEQSDVA